jgi:fructose-1,6-bisphosphatase/inositol monophosphatase family enzyme
VTLNSKVIADLKERVSALMRHAARTAILPRLGQLQHAEITEKTPGEVVTIADRESEQILTEGLLAILPDTRVVGEEACVIEPSLLEGIDEGIVWIVDPLDGTANFAAGHEPFGVIVALAENGVTLAGWLYNPVSDRMCHATLGGGASVSHGNETPRGVEELASGGPRIAMLATQFMSRPAEAAVVAAAAEAFDVQPIPRCAAEHYVMLARGENHVALFQRTLPWDHAAGALFLSEAGGVVSRWDGSPYRFYDDRVGILAASSEEMWRRARETLFCDKTPLSEMIEAQSPFGRLSDRRAIGRPRI